MPHIFEPVYPLLVVIYPRIVLYRQPLNVPNGGDEVHVLWFKVIYEDSTIPGLLQHFTCLFHKLTSKGSAACLRMPPPIKQQLCKHFCLE